MTCHVWEECGETYSRRWHVEEVPAVIFHHLIDTIVVSHVKRRVLVRSVEISGVLNRISLDFAARQRGIAVTALDDPQNSGGSDGCVVCFDDPRIVLFHANNGIITDSGFRSVCIWN